ncbi:hypothetical protein Taro_018641 [Colocasia esculenta]|uniref:Uncharacterized protein n=1 Tax=Colocasia esculenta TaxID=4460 RepID=A0A843UUC6_COLES|nr:hypothetical protein [Colocasia esculenta]
MEIKMSMLMCKPPCRVGLYGDEIFICSYVLQVLHRPKIPSNSKEEDASGFLESSRKAEDPSKGCKIPSDICYRTSLQKGRKYKKVLQQDKNYEEVVEQAQIQCCPNLLQKTTLAKSPVIISLVSPWYATRFYVVCMTRWSRTHVNSLK